MIRKIFEGAVTFSAFISGLVTIACVLGLIVGASFPADVFGVLSFSVPIFLLCLGLIYYCKISVLWFVTWLP